MAQCYLVLVSLLKKTGGQTDGNLKFKQSAKKVCCFHRGHSEQTWKESQRWKGKLIRPERKRDIESPIKHVEIKEPKKYNSKGSIHVHCMVELMHQARFCDTLHYTSYTTPVHIKPSALADNTFREFLYCTLV